MVEALRERGIVGGGGGGKEKEKGGNKGEERGRGGWEERGREVGEVMGDGEVARNVGVVVQESCVAARREKQARLEPAQDDKKGKPPPKKDAKGAKTE
jgi:hypothetical protein